MNVKNELIKGLSEKDIEKLGSILDELDFEIGKEEMGLCSITCCTRISTR